MRRVCFLAVLCLAVFSPHALAAQDRALPWTLTPIFAVGGADDSTLVLSSLTFRDVAELPGNELALVDRVENQVVVLGPTGRVARRWGRHGAGPGELSFPTSLAAAPGGALWVWDASRPGLVGFSAQGSPLPPSATLPGSGLVQSFRFLSDNSVVLLRSRRDSLTLWSASASSVEVLAAITQLPAKSVSAGSCEITDYGARPVFSPHLLWAAQGNAIAINTESSFTIRIHGGRYGETDLTRDAKPQRATAALAKQELGPGIPITLPGRDRPCFIDSDEVIRTAGFAPLVPAYRQLVFTSADTLWAVRYTLPGESRLADVFVLPGGYVGTVALGSASPVGARTDGSIVSIENDADDVPRLVVYRVTH